MCSNESWRNASEIARFRGSQLNNYFPTHPGRAMPMIALAASLLLLMTVSSRALDRLQDPPAASGRAFSAVQGGAVTDIDLADLSALPQYKMLTNSPWEEGQQEFEGVLFRDVLALLQLADADAVILRAVDDYSARIPREDWINYPTLLALRANGAFLTRRNQGPTRLVYPVLEYPELDNPVHKNRWVWLIESIERAD
jgi:hypothetical protein